jgi:chromosome segregation ATPase
MQANLARVQDLTVELRRQLRPLGKQAEVAKKAATIQADLRDAKLRLLADDYITLSKTLDAEVADETALRERRSQVEDEVEKIRLREEALDAQAVFESPLQHKRIFIHLARCVKNFVARNHLRKSAHDSWLKKLKKREARVEIQTPLIKKRQHFESKKHNFALALKIREVL